MVIKAIGSVDVVDAKQQDVQVTGIANTLERIMHMENWVSLICLLRLEVRKIDQQSRLI